ncbi:hybrid sensor histidine kinase/response regulator [Pelotalea chapellei]|uniref:hybrid sensor histidine kinase/response regulator n=1 Tax=Pelotalea chapellei TaxID=44671 RepID=UPI001FE616FD|nr:hybrid sensor histidine kinase/response regulator [Pelotalea chapellei]
MKVLIVDDNTDGRRILRYIAERHGHTVIEAANGREGLDKAASDLPELIISDVLMPIMDGFQFLLNLKKDSALYSIPFIFYSATYGEEKDVQLGTYLGAEGYIVKPKDPSEIWDEVESILGNFQAKHAVPIHINNKERILLEQYNEVIALKLEEKVKELEDSQKEREEAYSVLEKTLEKEKLAKEALQESERKYRQLNEELEQRVEDSVKEMRQKDEILIYQGRQAAMGEMINNIAHQWRQPLNTLGLLAQELNMTRQMGDLNKDFVDANVKKTLEIIHQMSKTIDDFRNFFKPDKEKTDFKVFDAINKAVSMLEGSFKAAQIRTEIQQTGDRVISGYPGDLIQALLIILNNAKDALINRKTDNPVISISLFTESNRTVVSITDNAGGIPKEIINRIFDPYFTTKGPEQGTGIGLFMCKTIIEKNMNGMLSVRNVKDGAQFRIEV